MKKFYLSALIVTSLFADIIEDAAQVNFNTCKNITKNYKASEIQSNADFCKCVVFQLDIDTVSKAKDFFNNIDSNPSIIKKQYDPAFEFCTEYKLGRGSEFLYNILYKHCKNTFETYDEACEYSSRQMQQKFFSTDKKADIFAKRYKKNDKSFTDEQLAIWHSYVREYGRNEQIRIWKEKGKGIPNEDNNEGYR